MTKSKLRTFSLYMFLKSLLENPRKSANRMLSGMEFHD